MNIIIAGAGKVGYDLAENLSKENHSVVIIDKNPQILRKAEENLDVMCIKGSATSTSVLLESGVKEADLLMAVTGSDEINMVCCLTAKKLGVAYTIARIRDPEYAKELSLLKEELELEMVINPELAAADEIAKSLNFSPAINVESFAKGRVRMIQLKVTKEMGLEGKSLKSILYNTGIPVLIGAVIRDNEVIVPNGNFALQENDNIYVIGKASGLYNFCKLAGLMPLKLKNVMILGGGRISYYLTNMLSDMGMKVKIIEIDRERCLELSELLPKTLIINADGTDEDILLSENLQDMDAFIAVTGIDEENLLSSLLAKQNGVKKVIAKNSRVNYMNVLNNLGIDHVISPKKITTDQILKYIRGGKVESLYRIVEGKAEILEFIVDKNHDFINKPLKNIKFKEDCIIATIVRKNTIIIPNGNDSIIQGDRVIVISKEKNINGVEDLILNVNGGIENEFWNGLKKFGDFINK